MIRDRLRAPAVAVEDDDDDSRIAPRELAAFLAGQYADAGWSRTDHYDWISGLLLELEITTLAQLGEVLRATDDAVIQDRMGYRYPPGAVRRLDDALLNAFGDRYVRLSGNGHRVDALQSRLDKLPAARSHDLDKPARSVSRCRHVVRDVAAVGGGVRPRR